MENQDLQELLEMSEERYAQLEDEVQRLYQIYGQVQTLSDIASGTYTDSIGAFDGLVEWKGDAYDAFHVYYDEEHMTYLKNYADSVNDIEIEIKNRISEQEDEMERLAETITALRSAAIAGAVNAAEAMIRNMV